MKKEQIGILQMVACAVLWSTAGIFIKLLPWNGFAVASLRSLIAGITIACCGDDGLNAIMKALEFAHTAINDQRCDVDD